MIKLLAKKDLCKFITRISELPERHKDFLMRYTNNEPDIYGYCNKNKEEQELCTKSIRCVPLDLIENVAIWNPSRIENIRKWTDRETINVLKINYNKKTDKKEYDIYDRHPRLSRTISIDKPIENRGKFRISNGIHRTNRAKELGISCTIAEVEECISIKKTDVSKIQI